MTVCNSVWVTHPRRPLHSVGQAGVDNVLLRGTLQRNSSVNTALRPCSTCRTPHQLGVNQQTRFATQKATKDQHRLNSQHYQYVQVCPSLRLSSVTSQDTYSDSGLEVSGGDDRDGSALLTKLPF